MKTLSEVATSLTMALPKRTSHAFSTGSGMKAVLGAPPSSVRALAASLRAGFSVPVAVADPGIAERAAQASKSRPAATASIDGIVRVAEVV
ncbi:MAG: hypothetical protein OXJ90_11540 [Spirochaetaceae bacterium]|nr:hypothetical protein [Spirochaetaceae bacterium]